jgi:hypothetical protein
LIGVETEERVKGIVAADDPLRIKGGIREEEREGARGASWSCSAAKHGRYLEVGDEADQRAQAVGDQKERVGKLGQQLVKRAGGLLRLGPKKKKRGSAGMKRRNRREGLRGAGPAGLNGSRELLGRREESWAAGKKRERWASG